MFRKYTQKGHFQLTGVQREKWGGGAKNVKICRKVASTQP